MGGVARPSRIRWSAAAGGRIYVADSVAGDIRIYDLSTAALVGRFSTGQGGFVQDLVVLKMFDVEAET